MKNKTIFLVLSTLLLTSCVPSRSNPVDSSVLIHVKVQRDDGKRGWGTCSGVYVEKNTILTAAHCFEVPEGMELLQVWVGKNDGTSAKGEIIDLSPERDLALVHTQLDGIPVPLAHSVRQDIPLEVIGNPLGINFVITRGIVSKVNFKMGDNPTKHFILSAIVLPGNSGGPVFDENGFLIGILVRSTSMLGSLGGSGLGIAVDIHEIRGFLGE